MSSFSDHSPYVRHHAGDPGLPVVSLAAIRSRDERRKRELAQALARVCRERGYFYVEDHGVPEDMLAAAQAAVHGFFDLPLADKMAINIADSPFHRGYVPAGGETAYGSTIKDIKEAFDMALELGPDDPDVRAGKFFHGPNNWPPAQPLLRPTLSWLYREWLQMCGNISELFALGLGLPNTYFAERTQKPLAQLRAARYPEQPPGDTGGAIGCGTHTDYGIVTVIWQMDAEGLEVCDPAGRWVRAPRIPGTFTCLLGNVTGMWTNDHWRATPHRVLNVSGETRHSLNFFFDPDYDCVVEPLPPFVTAAKPARYAPTTMGAHLVQSFDGVFEYRKQDSQTETMEYQE
ncbi:isopenicillin N synthase family oxygenase [Acidovorax sp. NCPPB 2350]|nr:isopenicillin N synthase family oxygenase [Acidovorax sp. NCPPB 2350]